MAESTSIRISTLRQLLKCVLRPKLWDAVKRVDNRMPGWLTTRWLVVASKVYVFSAWLLEAAKASHKSHIQDRWILLWLGGWPPKRVGLKLKLMAEIMVAQIFISTGRFGSSTRWATRCGSFWVSVAAWFSQKKNPHLHSPIYMQMARQARPLRWCVHYGQLCRMLRFSS